MRDAVFAVEAQRRGSRCPTPKPTQQRRFEGAGRAPAARAGSRPPRRSRARSRRCAPSSAVRASAAISQVRTRARQRRAGGQSISASQARVGVLDGAPGGGVARLGLRRLVARRPRRRIGQLRLERAQRLLGLLRPPARPSAARCSLFFDGPSWRCRSAPSASRPRARIAPPARRAGAPSPSRWRAARAPRPAARRARPASARRRGPPAVRAALFAGAHVLGPAAEVAVQRASSTATVRVPTASSSARSWETSRIAPRNARSASSSASRLSMSRWLVGSSRISTLGGFATADEHGQRQAPALAAGEAAERLVGLLARRTGSARAARAPCRAQPGGALGGVEHALLRPRRPRRARRRAGRGSRSSRCGRC